MLSNYQGLSRSYPQNPLWKRETHLHNFRDRNSKKYYSNLSKLVYIDSVADEKYFWTNRKVFFQTCIVFFSFHFLQKTSEFYVKKESPCLDYTLMDYSRLDYLWLDYKDSWTTPNWTTYDAWTTAVWTTNHLDYTQLDYLWHYDYRLLDYTPNRLHCHWDYIRLDY